MLKHLMLFTLLGCFCVATPTKAQNNTHYGNEFELRLHNPADHDHSKCMTNYRRAKNFERYPELIEQRRQIQEAQARWLAENGHLLDQQRAVITIPTVVHVVYNGSTQNISESQINSQIAVLNADFRQMNSDFSSVVPAAFQSVAADVEFEFCLAQLDPSGNATTGITRTSTTSSEIGNGYDLFYSSSGGQDAWDASKYLNIWVCEIDAGGGLLGYATIPGSAPAAEDGVVIDYKYFGTEGTATAPIDLGRTATHEVGHWFNLEHIWGDGPCGTDDGVSDTPEAAADYAGCPSHPQSSCGSDDMFMNFMDYVDDACMAFFTEGQKTRMLAAINGPRSGILGNSGACGTVGVTKFENELSVSVYPNPVGDGRLRVAVNTEMVYSAKVRVMDLTGKTHLQRTIEKFDYLDVSSLNAGIYFVEVMNDNKKSIHKIVVQ